MKQCIGCVHLKGDTYCLAENGEWHYVRNPYTAKGRLEPVDGKWLLPSVIEMRSDAARCGPEAKLWAPNWWFRLWRMKAIEL